MSACTLSLSSLKRGENHVAWSLSAEDLDVADDVVTLAGPVAVALIVFREGDNIEIRGDVRGVATDVCSRCGAPTTWPIEAELRLFAMRAAEEEGVVEGADDALLVHDGLTLDVGDPIREAVILEVPMAPLCRDDCLGLCPNCGENRNERACGCEAPAGDPRWQALTDVIKNKKTESGSS